MAGLDEYIFGYEKGEVEEKDVPKLVNALFKLGISSEVTPTGNFTLRHRDRKKFTSYAKAKMRFSLSEPLGLYGFLCRAKRRYGLLLGLLAVLLVYIFSSRLVWDIRISGNERLTDYAIEETLNEYGLRVGSSWHKLDKNLIEAELLAAKGDIAWISVNRRGTVAYVEVIESENVGESEDVGFPFSNIVADRDGVIEEITVESGVAAVKVGDVVRRGDILISGIVENENSVSFCRARGSVRASNAVNISVEAPEIVKERIPSRRRLREVRLLIFNFSINIFKNYGNHGDDCDIIKETRKFALFDKYRLPIRLEKAYLAEYTDTERTLSKDEMTEYAARQLDRKIYSMFRNADVIGISSQGEFSDGTYRLISRVVYSTDIGKESAIDIK